MKSEKSWWANIYVGLHCKDEDKTYAPETLKWVCEDFCNEVGFCVTFTPTYFIYTAHPPATQAGEPGVIVGCIQYPRFPLPNEQNRERAIELAKRLMKASNQYRVSIMMPDEVVMLERENDL